MAQPRTSTRSDDEKSIKNIFTMFSFKDVISVVTTLIALAGAFYAYDKRIAIIETKLQVVTENQKNVMSTLAALEKTVAEHIISKEPILLRLIKDHDDLKTSITDQDKRIRDMEKDMIRFHSK